MLRITGLSQINANRLLKSDGFNEIPSQKPQSIFHLIIKVISEPMILLLLMTGTIYLFLGEPRDSLVLFISIFVVIGITLYQERKTEKALQALKDLSSPRALIIRDGVQKRIAGREVVVGDVIVLQEGDRVPADGVVLESQNLYLDESLLTGESLPVHKHDWDGKTEYQTGGDNSAYVFSGTLIAQGSGMAQVTKIGLATEMGKIGKTLQTITDSDSLLKKEINNIIKIFGTVGISCAVLLFFIYAFFKNDLLNGLLRGLTLAMSMLPEEFPMVLTIFLALGAWRISKKNVLTRNSQAIETLGATTVLCVDKTGTLTQNRMNLSTLMTAKQSLDLTNLKNITDLESSHLLFYAKLSSKRGAFDPLEKEINTRYAEFVDKDENDLKNWHLLKSYSLTKEVMAVSRIWKAPKQAANIVSSKGAPETIMQLCHLSEKEKAFWMEKVNQLTSQGQRVLAVASGKLKAKQFPSSQKGLKINFLGLVGFVDPLRPSVSKSMQECVKAGIRVIMITGDYPGTALYIASKAGIDAQNKYITGTELASISEAELREKIKDINVFARVVPDQKLKIVQALKANGEVVAMTGDGVNDGPALKAAHIGIAMGNKGTDVARESADLVLLDDNFSDIVAAVGMGRRIYDNLKKAVTFIFSVHIPIAGVSLLPVFLDLPFVLFPIHIAFLELIIDPASSIAFEMEESESDIMSRPPRKISQPLFSKSDIAKGLMQGLLMLVLTMLVFTVALRNGRPEGSARGIAFLTMVMGNLVLIRTNLTQKSVFRQFKIHQNKSFILIAATTLLFNLAIIYIPFLSDLFHFEMIITSDFLKICAIVLASYFGMELLKFISRSNKFAIKI